MKVTSPGGKKDFVSIKDAGGRKHIQKRLVLCNPKELYQHFKDKHPSVKIGFSKFAELRPRNCDSLGGTVKRLAARATTY